MYRSGSKTRSRAVFPQFAGQGHGRLACRWTRPSGAAPAPSCCSLRSAVGSHRDPPIGTRASQATLCTVRRNMPPVGVPLETSTRVTLFAQLQCFCQEYYKTLSFFPKYQSCPEPHKACCHHQAILGMDFDSLPLMLSGLSHSALINEQGLSHPRALIICS